MNAEQLIMAARKQADYDASVISILEQGRDDQKRIVMSLEGDEREQAAKLLRALSNELVTSPRASRVVIALVAFEIQIENAMDKQSQRNN